MKFWTCLCRFGYVILMQKSIYIQTVNITINFHVMKWRKNYPKIIRFNYLLTLNSFYRLKRRYTYVCTFHPQRNWKFHSYTPLCPTGFTTFRVHCLRYSILFAHTWTRQVRAIRPLLAPLFRFSSFTSTVDDFRNLQDRIPPSRFYLLKVKLSSTTNIFKWIQ